MALEVNDQVHAPAAVPPMKGNVPIAEYADWSAEPVWISGCEKRKFLVPVGKFTLMYSNIPVLSAIMTIRFLAKRVGFCFSV